MYNSGYGNVLGRNFKKAMLFGDMHLHDTHKGRHKNYLENCFYYMSVIEDMVRKQKPDFVVFAGDIIGVREAIIKNRNVLLEICKWFERLNTLTNNNVYSLKGNHDMAENTDYDFLAGLGILKTSTTRKYLDLTNEEGVTACRFHLVDYGKEKESIELCQEMDATNIVVFHNNMKIQGVTDWYPDHKGFLLSKQYNWEGCDMAIGGHIHVPSPYMVETTINNQPIELFYLGCPTMPTKDKYTSTWSMVFEYDKETGSIVYDAHRIELRPEDEVFIKAKYVEDVSEEEIAETIRREDLHEVIKDLIQYRIADGDPITMIRNLPNTKERAVDIACEYVTKAFEERAKAKGR